MTSFNRTLYPLAALSLIATGVFSTPVTADMEVVAVMATQTRLNNITEVFELGADKQELTKEFSSQLNNQLGDRLADEFDSSKRSAFLASEFSAEILDALDKRLPNEVDNLISAAD